METLASYQNHAKEIIDPFFKSTDIDFCCYERLYTDNRGIYLSSEPDINKEAISKKAVNTYSKINQLFTDRRQINSLHNIFFFLLKEDNIAANSIMNGRGYNNSLVIADFHKDGYFEGVTFASHRDEDLVRFCFSHWDVLVQFKQYFLSHSEDLINDADKTRIQLSFDNDKARSTSEGGVNMPFLREQFNQDIVPKFYSIMHENQQFKITTKEFECLKCCGQGRKDKETAKITNLAPKTVEHYLAGLKEKFSVGSRSQLIDIYLASELVVL
ncbi:MAG: helix-turn-helix transcriptional regulator [Gammaproteobacteria bacterium]|nr:helix-turn-helix transcriptional regulator [Gammaproteobacteria bacterium]MCH9744538.1 helix-turn-helix transcriptional regulator [Gammaproteobacteria bacterium]